MKGSKAAQRYAKAILEDAISAKAGETVFGDMQTIYETIGKSRELKNVLNSPVVKPNDKREALLEIFRDTSEKSRNLIGLLVDNQRIGLLEKVANAYIALYNEFKGVKTATVTTAVPLTEVIEALVLKKIKELTGSDRVSLESYVDPDIIGGFVLRIGDLEYNASIANNLSKLKREFSLN